MVADISANVMTKTLQENSSAKNFLKHVKKLERSGMPPYYMVVRMVLGENMDTDKFLKNCTRLKNQLLPQKINRKDGRKVLALRNTIHDSLFNRGSNGSNPLLEEKVLPDNYAK